MTTTTVPRLGFVAATLLALLAFAPSVAAATDAERSKLLPVNRRCVRNPCF